MSDIDRRALRAVAVQFFVNGAVLGSIFTRLPEIRDQLDISLATLGVTLTVAGVAGLISSAITPRAIERFSTRSVLILGATMQVSFLLLVGFSWHVAVFAVAMAGISFIDVLVDLSMNLQASWLSSRRSVPVMNRLHGLWSLGSLSGGLVAATLAALGVSLRAHLIGSTIVLLAVLTYVGKGLLRSDEKPTREARQTPKRAANPRRLAVTLGLFAIAGASTVAVEQVSSDWAALRLSDDLGAGAGIAGLAFAAFTAGMTIGRFSGDTVLAAIGRDRLFYWSCVVALAGLSLAAFAPGVALVCTGYLIGGIGIASFFPMLYDDAAQMPGRTGAALGAMSAGSRASGLVTPTLIGALAATGLSVGAATATVVIPVLFILPIARWLLDH